MFARSGCLWAAGHARNGYAGNFRGLLRTLARLFDKASLFDEASRAQALHGAKAPKAIVPQASHEVLPGPRREVQARAPLRNVQGDARLASVQSTEAKIISVTAALVLSRAADLARFAGRGVQG
jgi:hypothetical protein